MAQRVSVYDNVSVNSDISHVSLGQGKPLSGAIYQGVQAKPLNVCILAAWYLLGTHRFSSLLEALPSLFSVPHRTSCACLVANRVGLFATSWTVARQAPLSLGFSRQEYWSGLPFPLPSLHVILAFRHRTPENPALPGYDIMEYRKCRMI